MLKRWQKPVVRDVPTWTIHADAQEELRLHDGVWLLLQIPAGLDDLSDSSPVGLRQQLTAQEAHAWLQRYYPGLDTSAYFD
jgi:hypothetical protein